MILKMQPGNQQDPPGAVDPEPLVEGRIRRSLRLSGEAWSVVRRDRGLLILSVCSGASLMASFVLIFGLSGSFEARGMSGGRAAVVGLLLAYPLTFIGVFLQTAIAAAAAGALDGRPLTVRQALSVPARKLGQVALWALLATGVGVLLDQIAQRLPLGGRIVTWILGAAWSVATLFAVPILALEGCSAPACARRSIRLAKEQWGDAVGGNLAITAWAVLLAMPAGALIGLGSAMSAESRMAGTTLTVSGCAVFAATFAVVGAIRETFAVALYRYATQGTSSGPFARRDLQHPFAPRRGGGGEPALRLTRAQRVRSAAAGMLLSGATFWWLIFVFVLLSPADAGGDAVHGVRAVLEVALGVLGSLVLAWLTVLAARRALTGQRHPSPWGRRLAVAAVVLGVAWIATVA